MNKTKVITVTIDASGKPIGRVASQVAHVLQGKHRADFVKQKDPTDRVCVTNIDQAIFTGKKMKDKVYHHHSGHPGGLKTQSVAQMMDKGGMEAVLLHAVKRMLPDNRLRTERMKRIECIKL
ncbi:MAG: 50S ribosomal protein L13 [Patescibacteria group bacterium]